MRSPSPQNGKSCSAPRAGKLHGKPTRRKCPHIEALELIQQEPHPNGDRHYYRAITAEGRRLLIFVLTPERSLAALGSAPI